MWIKIIVNTNSITKNMIFKDRQDAGKQLAEKLKNYKDNPGTIILGLPRGGVVVAFEVAQALNLPLDIIVPRKIGAPGNPELAIGAITEDGEEVFDRQIIYEYGIPQEYIKKEVEKGKKEADRRLKLYRSDRPPLDLKNKTAILVDDGIATGSTMVAAIRSARKKEAEKIIVAVPTTARDSLKKVQNEADEVIYVDAPMFFGAICAFYKIFTQTEDQEVIELMEKANK